MSAHDSSSAQSGSPLEVLATALDMPAHVFAKIRSSGCETPAEWKYSFLEKPDDRDEARLWQSVQQAEALDVGAVVRMTVAAYREAGTERRQQVAASQARRKPQRRAKRKPFRGVRKPLARKQKDHLARQKIADRLMDIAAKWAPHAGPARGCNLAGGDWLQKRLARCKQRLVQNFEAKVLHEAERCWKSFHEWLAQEDLVGLSWPIDGMFIEDFLETFREKGRSVPRARYNALVFLEKHLQAPLLTSDVHVPVPAATVKAARGQATPLQPAMAKRLREAFTQDAEENSWRKVVTAVAVVASMKPMRFAHINRSRPVARTRWWTTFWASKGKARDETGQREGYRWSVATPEPVVQRACQIIWDEWHKLATSRAQLGEELPEYICFDSVTGIEISLSQFNQAIEDIVAPVLDPANQATVSSYSLRRVPPGLLHMRAADWEERLALAGWRAGRLKADNLMPLRYSGEKFNMELKVGAAQARMTAAWADECLTWAQARVWWTNQPSGLVREWESEYLRNLQQDMADGMEPCQALGLDALLVAVGEAKLKDKEFKLAALPAPIQSVQHFTVKTDVQAKKARTGPQVPASAGWIMSTKLGGVLHCRVGAAPLCGWKKPAKQYFRAGFSVAETEMQAIAMMQLQQGSMCKSCARMKKGISDPEGGAS